MSEASFPHPCTHCGFCCVAEVCPAGQMLMEIPQEQYRQPCPALEWEGDQSRCGLITHPEKHLPAKHHRSPYMGLSQERRMEVLGMFGSGCCYSGSIVTGMGAEQMQAMAERSPNRVVSAEALQSIEHMERVPFAPLPAEVKLELTRRLLAQKGRGAFYLRPPKSPIERLKGAQPPKS